MSLHPHFVLIKMELVGQRPAAMSHPVEGLCANGRKAGGGHGLPKISPKLAMPYTSTPCGRATPETALQSFQVSPTHRAGGLWPSSTPLDTPRVTSMFCATEVAAKWHPRLQLTKGEDHLGLHHWHVSRIEDDERRSSGTFPPAIG
jgi:hypothetical protein